MLSYYSWLKVTEPEQSCTSDKGNYCYYLHFCSMLNLPSLQSLRLLISALSGDMGQERTGLHWFCHFQRWLSSLSSSLLQCSGWSLFHRPDWPGTRHPPTSALSARMTDVHRDSFNFITPTSSSWCELESAEKTRLAPSR